jgi:hypothetical protein
MLFRVCPCVNVCVNSVVTVRCGGYVPSQPRVSESLSSNERLLCCWQRNLGNVFTEPLSRSGHMRHNMQVWCLSWDRWIQSTHPRQSPLRVILILLSELG